MNSTNIRKPWLILMHQPKTVATIIGLALAGWIAWEAYGVWPDQPIPTEKLTAKRLKVSTGQLTTLQQHLNTYHAPVTLPASLRSPLGQ